MALRGLSMVRTDEETLIHTGPSSTGSTSSINAPPCSAANPLHDAQRGGAVYFG
jgi:hypothetical protein